jgi:chromosome segregation ATPase
MKEQRRVFQKINKINEKTELGTQKVELGKIEDLIQERTKEADKLWNKVNSLSATARSISAGVKNAEKEYNEAKQSFENFLKAEKRYNETLDYVDDLYRILKAEGFKQLNQYADLYDELNKYTRNVKDYKTQSKEMLQADKDWKSISSKFPKIK